MKLNKFIASILVLIGFVGIGANIAYADNSASTQVSVGFYVAEEDLGLQFKEDENGKYIQNFENFTVRVEDEDGNLLISDENVIYVDKTEGLSITAMMVPYN